MLDEQRREAGREQEGGGDEREQLAVAGAHSSSPRSSASTRSSASSRDRSWWSVKVARRAGGTWLERHAGRVPALVEVDAEGQLVGQPAEDGDGAAVAGVRADEVDGAGGEPGADQERQDAGRSSSRTRPPPGGAGACGAGPRRRRAGARSAGGGSRAGAAAPAFRRGDGLQRDRAGAPVLRLRGVVRASRTGRLTPWRGGSASPANVSYSSVGAPGLDGHRAAGRRRRVVDLLEPEEDHGDVVAPAGLVGRGDQRAADLLERAARGCSSGLSCGSWTMPVSPSEQTRKTSPPRAGKTSTSTSTSAPARARA